MLMQECLEFRTLEIEIYLLFVACYLEFYRIISYYNSIQFILYIPSVCRPKPVYPRRDSLLHIPGLYSAGSLRF